MATKQIRIDDLTGKPLEDDVEPTIFVHRGVEYTLDLGPQSARMLDEALAPFIRAAVATPRPRVDAEAIRDWARAQGLDISPRGRLSLAVMRAYNAAHGEPEKQ